jgi:hypothetical protein
MGPPIVARPDFDLAELLRRSNEGRMEREDLGDESADEREVEDYNNAPIDQPSSPTPGPSIPAAAPTGGASAHKRTRKQQHVKDLRARNRAAQQGKLKTVTIKRRQDMQAIQADLVTEDLSATSSGWLGGRVPTDKASHTLDEVTKTPYNLRHVKWDGRYVETQFLFFLSNL